MGTHFTPQMKICFCKIIPVHNLSNKLCTKLFKIKRLFKQWLINLRDRFKVPLNEITRRKSGHFGLDPVHMGQISSPSPINTTPRYTLNGRSMQPKKNHYVQVNLYWVSWGICVTKFLYVKPLMYSSYNWKLLLWQTCGTS